MNERATTILLRAVSLGYDVAEALKLESMPANEENLDAICDAIRVLCAFEEGDKVLFSAGFGRGVLDWIELGRPGQEK